MGEETKADMEVNTDKPKSFFAINKNLIMLKLTLFFLYGATSSLIPYLTIHMQSIGLTMEEIALVYLALPFTTFLAPPLTGYLVDKFGKYKPIVIVCFVFTAIIHHALLYMPHQELPGVVPAGYIIRHPKKMYVEVWWSPCPSRNCPDMEELDIVLDLCVDHCLLTDLTKKMQGGDPSDKDDLSFHIKKKQRHDAATGLTLDMHPNLGDPIEQLGIELESAEDDEDVTEFKNRFKSGMLRRHGVDMHELEGKDLRCGGIVMKANTSTQALITNYTNDCILQKCQFTSGGPVVCPPDYVEANEKTFWIYFVLRFLGSMVMSSSVTIMDPVALAMIEKFGGDFGKERLFSSLGMAIFSPITGALIDWNSRRLGYTDYSSAFYTFDILLVMSSICLLMMPIGSKLPADNLFLDLLNIFKMPHLLVFIFFLYLLGNLWGFIESFLFFYLKDLGAPNYLLGITVTVGTLSSVPFLYGAGSITKSIGHINVIILAFFAHALRLVGYSVIESAWWCFPFEALESISVHLMWVAAATYCAFIAPKGLLATLIGVCGMAHYSVGRGSGSFIGGHIIGKFGIRQAFKVMGLVAVFAGGTYALCHYTCLRNIVEEDEEEDEEEIETQGAETDKLQDEEPKYKDQGTTISFERLDRLSLVVEYNQIGSLTSLGRTNVGHPRSNSIRRGSLGLPTKSKHFNSKADLLKSTIDIHRRASVSQTKSSNGILSAPSTGKDKGDYAPRDHHGSISVMELGPLIPNEKDEIVYDEIERATTEKRPDDLTEEPHLETESIP